MLKTVAAKVKGFVKNESGISGIVVAIALIVLGGLGAYYVWTNNLQHTLNGASSTGGAIESSGSAAASDWGAVK